MKLILTNSKGSRTLGLNDLTAADLSGQKISILTPDEKKIDLGSFDYLKVADNVEYAITSELGAFYFADIIETLSELGRIQSAISTPIRMYQRIDGKSWNWVIHRLNPDPVIIGKRDKYVEIPNAANCENIVKNLDGSIIWEYQPIKKELTQGTVITSNTGLPLFCGGTIGQTIIHLYYESDDVYGANFIIYQIVNKSLREVGYVNGDALMKHIIINNPDLCQF